MIFTDCLPTCVASCQYLDVTCETSVRGGVCTSGCGCSSGLVFNGTYCVERSDCPCHANNVFYKPGFIWKENCSECICWENEVKCTKKLCPVISFCPRPRYEITVANCCEICTPVSVTPTTFLPTTRAHRCKVDEFHCNKSDACISYSWICDGENDCAHGEDESDCEHVLSVKPIGELPGQPGANWNATVMPDGKTGYCLQKQNDSLSFETELGLISEVTMVGSEVLSKNGTYKEFSIEYSMNGTTWNTYTYDIMPFNASSHMLMFKLEKPFQGRFVRIKSSNWTMSECLRYVIFGYINITVTQAPSVTTVPITPCAGFTCNNSRCINERWRCDGSNDCNDNSDELNCPPKNCSSDQFICNNSKCIGIDHVCDGDNDCGDGSDETPGCVKPTCSSTQFTCNNSRCIPRRFLCDGESDCSNGEDEDPKNCLFTTQPAECEFLCPDGECIPKKWICDYFKDCNNSIDESNCTCQDTSQWRCPRSEKCISIDYICDGTVECPNGEDEESCPTILPTTIVSTVPSIPTTAQPITNFTTPVTTPPVLCTTKGNVYKVGVTWLQDECYRCRCLDGGSIDCSLVCPIVNCPQGKVLVTSPTECCKCQPPITTPPVIGTGGVITASTRLPMSQAVITTPPSTPTSLPTTQVPVIGCINVTCSCPQTCESVASGGDTCSASECLPGCQCSSGTILENDLCVGQSTCPCYHEGKVYKFGEQYHKDVCITCTCLQDGFSCQKTCNNISCLPNEERAAPADKCCYCRQKCRVDMIYKQCSCPLTCESTTCNSQNCQPGCECSDQEYDDGTKCVPLTDCYCIINGTRRESEETWFKENCLKCSCKDGVEQCNKTCNITNCPQGYELVAPYKGCCVCIKRVTTAPITIITTTRPGCIVNGTRKPIGDNWTNDLCENCTCENLNQIKCVITTCPATCPQGCKIQRMPGKCCNECVPLSSKPAPIVCIDNGDTHQAGDWWSPDSCQNCSCSDEGRVTCRIKECLRYCPIGYESRFIPGQCCNECVPITKCTATNTTSVITDKNGCTSNNAIISSCDGPCKSNTTLSVFGNQTITNCQCCTPKIVEQQSTQMRCPDGSTYVHRYPVIHTCSCTICGL